MGAGRCREQAAEEEGSLEGLAEDWPGTAEGKRPCSSCGVEVVFGLGLPTPGPLLRAPLGPQLRHSCMRRGTWPLNLQPVEGVQAGRWGGPWQEPLSLRMLFEHNDCILSARLIPSKIFLVGLFCLFCTIPTAQGQGTVLPGDAMGPPSPLSSLPHALRHPSPGSAWALLPR